MRLLPGIIVVLTLLFLNFCTYGEVEDGIENQEYALQFLLNNVRGTLDANRRFSDESTGSIHTFTTGAGNIELTTLNLSFESTELVYAGGFFEGIVHFIYNPFSQSGLYAHGEEEVAGEKRFETGPFVFQLASAAQTQTDLAGISYQASVAEQSVPAGTINSVIFHVKSVEAAGTRDGAPFAVVLNEEIDVPLVLKCPVQVGRSGSARKVVQFNITKLFETGADSASVRTGLKSGSVLREPECFKL